MYDEPFSDSSQIPTYLVSEIAKKNVTVALTGDGGDELFGGYNRYLLTNKYWPILNLTPFFFRQVIGNILGNQSIQKYSEKLNKIGVKLRNIKTIKDLYFNYTTELNMASRILKNEYHNQIPKDNFQDKSLIQLNNVEKMMYFDVERYLPDDLLCKVDRASMFHSLETRAPFLNHKIYEYSLKIPFDEKIYKNNTKVILKSILSKYIPKKIFERPKKGFGIPIKQFLFNELREWSKSILFDKYYEDPFLDQKEVQKFWELTDKNKLDLSSTIWSIISYRIWLKENEIIMIIYSIIIILPFVLSILNLSIKKEEKFKLDFLWFSYLLFSLFIFGFRYQIGGDWNNYYAAFMNIANFDFSQKMSPGFNPNKININNYEDSIIFYLLNISIGRTFNSFIVFNLICSIIFIYSINKFCKILETSKYVMYGFFASYLSIVVHLGYVRQSLAIAFLALSFYFYFKNKITNSLFFLLFQHKLI